MCVCDQRRRFVYSTSEAAHTFMFTISAIDIICAWIGLSSGVIFRDMCAKTKSVSHIALLVRRTRIIWSLFALRWNGACWATPTCSTYGQNALCGANAVDFHSYIVTVVIKFICGFGVRMVGLDVRVLFCVLLQVLLAVYKACNMGALAGSKRNRRRSRRDTIYIDRRWWMRVVFANGTETIKRDSNVTEMFGTVSHKYDRDDARVRCRL